jgi:hypothetical protein
MKVMMMIIKSIYELLDNREETITGKQGRKKNTLTQEK